MLAEIKRPQKKVLAVASSGIADTILPPRDSDRTEILAESILIKFTITNKLAEKVVNRTL